MPPQLARGLRAKRRSRRTEQRPLAETLPCINVNDLQVPHDYKTYVAPSISFRYPHLTESRFRESAHGDKWSFCLTAGKIGPRIRREDEQETAAEPHIGL